MGKHAKIDKGSDYLFSHLEFQQKKKHVVQLNQPGPKHQFKLTQQEYYKHIRYSESRDPYKGFYHYAQLFLAACFSSLFPHFLLITEFVIIYKYSLIFTNNKCTESTHSSLCHASKTRGEKKKQIPHVFAISPLATYVGLRVASFSFLFLPTAQNSITRLYNVIEKNKIRIIFSVNFTGVDQLQALLTSNQTRSFCQLHLLSQP